MTLALNNLGVGGGGGEEFQKNGNGAQVHQCIVEHFPQLDQRGYSILRKTSETGRSKDLMKISMPSAGFSLAYFTGHLTGCGGADPHN